MDKFENVSTLDLHVMAEQAWDDIQSKPVHDEDEQRQLWAVYNEIEAEIDRRRKIWDTTFQSPITGI